MKIIRHIGRQKVVQSIIRRTMLPESQGPDRMMFGGLLAKLGAPWNPPIKETKQTKGIGASQNHAKSFRNFKPAKTFVKCIDLNHTRSPMPVFSTENHTVNCMPRADLFDQK